MCVCGVCVCVCVCVYVFVCCCVFCDEPEQSILIGSVCNRVVEAEARADGGNDAA